MGYVFSRKWLGLLPRVDHFVDWCRSENKNPVFMIVLKRAVAKNCDWICSFWILLDLLGFFSLIQTSIPIVPWKICVKIAFFSWSSFLLWDRFCDWNILEPEKVSIFRRIASTLLAKNRKIFMLQKLHEKKWIHLRKGGVKTTRG